MSFLAYQSYRDSGIEWLGEVPSHWSPTRLRFLAQLNPSKSEVSRFDLDTEVSFIPMEAVGERGGLSLDQTRPIGDVLTGYTYFREGDVSIAKITPCFENGKGAIMRGLSEGVGFGTTELIVVRARPDATTPEFLDWLFRSPAFRTRGEAAMYGAGGQKRVPDDFVRDFMSPGAPLDEQVAIAAFLDREIAKIDALLEEQRRLIALLKEKRQAVISHAVTEGLNPHAPMKDSGIEWLGEMPAHWTVKPLKRIGMFNAGAGFPHEEQGTEGKELSFHKVNALGKAGPDGILPVSEDSISRETATRLRAFIFPAGSIVFAKIGAALLLGRIRQLDAPACLDNNMMGLIVGDQNDADFIRHLMTLVRFDLIANPGTVPSLNEGQIANISFAFPPPAEQEAIAGFLRFQLGRFDELAAEAGKAIHLLNERRAALISAAVTGKIDVRGSAEVLPFPIERTRARALVGAEIIERSAGRPTFGRVKFQKVAFLAEGHVGISALAGCYTRAAAGPLDGALIEDMELGAHSIAGITVDQVGGTGTTVSYRLGQQRGAHHQELTDWLGPERAAKLDKLITDFTDLTTKQAEAVATLYGVWNDALSEGGSPTDDEIITGFLNDWHPEKRDKFRASELPEWLGWMRRHGIVPTGSGPKTTTGRLFL